MNVEFFSFIVIDYVAKARGVGFLEDHVEVSMCWARVLVGKAS